MSGVLVTPPFSWGYSGSCSCVDILTPALGRLPTMGDLLLITSRGGVDGYRQIISIVGEQIKGALLLQGLSPGLPYAFT